MRKESAARMEAATAKSSFRGCDDGLAQRTEEKEELAVAIARTWSGLSHLMKISTLTTKKHKAR